MNKTLLNKISVSNRQTHITDQWANDLTGAIIDIQGNYVYRFVDYLDFGESVREKYHSDEEKLSCKIVACGIVGYWIHNHDKQGIKNLFESYFSWQFKQYEQAHECDDDAWERDFKEEFLKKVHTREEKQRIKDSEAIFEDLTDEDKKRIQGITSSYLKFVRAKRKSLYPPHYDPNRVIEDTFLSAYSRGGGAEMCIDWFRHKYDLPMMGPHWHSEPKRELDKKWQDFYDVTLPEYILEEFEDFDDSVLIFSNGGLMEEIHRNLQACTSLQDRITYISSLLQPFKTFAEAFYSKGATIQRKKAIDEDLKAIEFWKTVPEDAVDSKTGEPLEPMEQIEACNDSIERYRQDIAYWEQLNSTFYDFAQRGLKKEFLPGDSPDMLVCLGRWWSLMIRFAHRLAALSLTFGIKLMDIQEECAIYLTHHFLITDYIDDKYISSIEQAQALLDKAFVIKQSDNANTKNRFENVLKIIYDDYTAFEELTHDKDSLSEEALRNHAVATLKAFGYTASAESLNRNGKTDIHIQDDNGLAFFIAECKIWKGEKLFLDAIDQLYGYLTWHNKNAALIVFVEQGNFTKTIETARKAIRKHHLFVRDKDKTITNKENSFSSVLHHSLDDSCLIDLEVLFFHFPKPTSSDEDSLH